MPADADQVVLTGYPSLLARAVCEEALRADEDAQVHAIVRPKFARAAAEAMGALPEHLRARVRLLEGDAAAIDMGLSGVELGALSRVATRIHHCAQVTYPGVPRAVAERVNVGGAREALELAAGCERLKCLVFHSTAHVSGDRGGAIREDELKAGQSFRNVVEETKARAERMMQAAMGRLPIAVVRPTTIVGDSRTGEVDRFEGPYVLIMLVVTAPADLALPLPGRGDEPMNLVPVDWVARAAVAVGRDPRSAGRTFHLADPHPLTLRRVLSLVARAGGRPEPRGSIPAQLATTILRVPGLDRVASGPRAFLETLATPVTYDAGNADDVLASNGVTPCPPLETYVDKLVEYAREHLRSPRDGRARRDGHAGDFGHGHGHGHVGGDEAPSEDSLVP